MSLTISILQPDIVWEDAEGNRMLYDEMLGNIPSESRLILLPEMLSTGFTMNAREVAETMDGPTMIWMAGHASKANAVVCGSIVVLENDRFYNRLIWMRPDGSYETYDKRHLFSMAGEDKVYTRGHTRSLMVVDGWKVFPQICYDLRFPVWARNTMEYDILVNVANWPHPRSYAWRSLLTARAIENQVYAVGVNRVGEDENGIYYSGGSCFIDPLGEVIKYIEGESGVYSYTLSKDHLAATRRKYPFLQDQDHFSIKNSNND